MMLVGIVVSLIMVYSCEKIFREIYKTYGVPKLIMSKWLNFGETFISNLALFICFVMLWIVAYLVIGPVFYIPYTAISFFHIMSWGFFMSFLPLKSNHIVGYLLFLIVYL